MNSGGNTVFSSVELSNSIVSQTAFAKNQRSQNNMDVGEGHVGEDKTEWGGSHQNAFLYMYEIVQEWIY